MLHLKDNFGSPLPAVWASGEEAYGVRLGWCLLLAFSVNNYRVYSLGSRLSFQSRDTFFIVSSWRIRSSNRYTEQEKKAASFVCFLENQPERILPSASGYLPKIFPWAFLGGRPMPRPCHTSMHRVWILGAAWWTKSSWVSTFETRKKLFLPSLAYQVKAWPMEYAWVLILACH